MSAARAVRGRLDEALPPPDPIIGQRAGGWVAANPDGVYRLTVEGTDPFRLVAETQIIEVLAVGPPSVGWSVFVEHEGLPVEAGRLTLADGFEPGWDAATAAAEISVSRFAAAARTANSPEALEALAASGDIGAVAAAANPACPPELLARLGEESASPDIVWAVASHPGTPPGVLAALVDDPGDMVTRIRVAQNPAAPLPLRYYVMRNSQSVTAAPPDAAGGGAGMDSTRSRLYAGPAYHMLCRLRRTLDGVVLDGPVQAREA